MIEVMIFGVEPSYRKGLRRLGLGLVMVWFVFWTFAYVLHSLTSVSQASPPAFSPSTDLALAATLLLLAPWVVIGFRREWR